MDRYDFNLANLIQAVDRLVAAKVKIELTKVRKLSAFDPKRTPGISFALSAFRMNGTVARPTLVIGRASLRLTRYG